MKSRYLFLLSFVLTLASVSLWRYLQATGTNAEKNSVASNLTEGSAPQSAKTTTVINPADPSMATSPANRAGPVASSESHAVDIVALNGAIADIVSLEKAGDMMAITKAYTEPDKVELAIANYQEIQNQIAEAEAKGYHTSPEMKAILQKDKEGALQSWTELQSQTPTFNAAGDEATYMYTIHFPDGYNSQPLPRVFIKIDGKWYLKPDKWG